MAVNMNNKKLSRLSIMLVICLCWLNLGGCSYSSTRPDSVPGQLPPDEEGKNGEAPAFTLSQLGGGDDINFPLDFSGQKVLLIFFSLG